MLNVNYAQSLYAECQNGECCGVIKRFNEIKLELFCFWKFLLVEDQHKTYLNLEVKKDWINVGKLNK